jgi:hypothetical protein
MPQARALSTCSLLRARAGDRLGLLVSAAATVAVAVATVTALLAGLALDVARAGDAARPGVAEADVAELVDAGVVALVSAAPALVLLVVIIAATAAAQLARLLAAAREDESVTLRARGLSRGQATIADAVEAAVIAVVGAVAGLGLTALLLALAGPAGWPSALAPLLWVAAPTAAVLGVVHVTAVRTAGLASTRGARGAAGATVALIVLAAAFVLWQLRRARPEGFDPIVAIAPTVVLLAAALLALAVFGAAAAAGAVVAATRPGLSPAYSARQIARRIRITAVAVLLIGLTVAQAVFASAYGATWTAMATGSAALRAGADLRVDLQPSAATPALVAAAASVDGVEAAAPALVMPIEIGGTDARLVALPGAVVDEIMTDAGVDPAALLAAAEPGDGEVRADAVALGSGATGLRLTAVIDASRAAAIDATSLRAIVRDAAGTTAPLRLDGVPQRLPDGTALLVAEASLPDGTGPWDLVAVTAAIAASFADATVAVELVGAEALGGGPLALTGQATVDQETSEQVVWPAPPAAGDEPAAVRAVLAAPLADRLGLGEGDRFDFRYAGSGRRGAVVVGGIVEAIPGAATGSALFAPLDVLEASMLQRGASVIPPTSVWASGDPSADAALSDALGGLPVAVAAPDATAQVVGALATGWWMAAAGSAALALIASFAIVQTLTLARRRELGVLRALGVAPVRQARMRAGELAAVLGAAVVLGAAAGGLVAAVLVPALVRAVTPGIIVAAAPVALSWPGLLLALGALAAGLAVVVGGAARGVARAAAAATVGEEAR